MGPKSPLRAHVWSAHQHFHFQLYHSHNVIVPGFSQKPAYGDKIENPHGKVTFKLLVGSILFGLGWGIGGLCPGPYILSIPNSLKIAVVWGVPFFFGQKIGNILFGDQQVHDKIASAEAVKEKPS